MKRGAELRNVCAFLVEDLFSNVLNTASVGEDIVNCVTTAPAGKGLSLPATHSSSTTGPTRGSVSAAVEGLNSPHPHSLPHGSNTQELGLHTKLTGRATFGVYPSELFPSFTADALQAKATSLVKIDASVPASYGEKSRSPGGQLYPTPTPTLSSFSPLALALALLHIALSHTLVPKCAPSPGGMINI